MGRSRIGRYEYELYLIFIGGVWGRPPPQWACRTVGRDQTSQGTSLEEGEEEAEAREEAAEGEETS